MNQWIKITNKKPPFGGRVLMYAPRMGVFVTQPKSDNPTFEYVGCNKDGPFLDIATHWMPLPEPPNDEPKKARCSKCIYELHCSKDKDNERNCPDYKRDAPDGGYYG